MATFIDPAAAGANDGSSWTNAYQTIAAAQTGTSNFTTGGPYAIRYNQTQTFSANTTLTGPTSGAPAVFISADGTGTTVTPTQASVYQWDATGASNLQLIFTGSFAFYGMKMKGGNGTGFISLNNGTDEVLVFDSCYIAPGGYFNHGGTNPGRRVFNNCTIDMLSSAASYSHRVTSNSRLEIIGGSTTNGGSMATEVIQALGQGVVFISGHDFSSITTAGCDFVGTEAIASIYVENCKFRSSMSWKTGTIAGSAADLIVVNSGNAYDAPQHVKLNYYGDLTSSESIYRTAGGEILGTPCSWGIVTSTQANETTPFRTEWIYGVVSATGSKNFDVYVAHNAQGTGTGSDLTDAEAWLEVQYLGTSGSAVTTFATDKRASVVATAADQTDDTTSLWAGSPGSNLQKLRVTATVNQTGAFRARVAIAKASATIYVDPLVIVS